MAPPVWTLMLLVGAAWGQDQVPALLRRQNSPDRKQLVFTSRENSVLSKCDFEDDTRPFCDWSQMSADDGDWVRTTGPSPTGTSGPPGGYPNGEGYYLHMDANTFPRGGVARLRSPDIWEQGPLCIHFAFHMFGLSWGAQLRLLLLRGRKHRRPNVLWKHVNTQSPSWMPTTVNVPANRDIPSWLMFEGMRGNTAYLDISLDGLSIQRGTCNRICMSQMCTFDILNDLCGWSWVPTATGAKWTQKKGSSGKLGVGPDDDFSSPGSGYYMLLDPMNARPGQKAVLLSPLSHSSSCLTLSFHYIMRGRSAGEGFFVYATFLGNIRKHTLFSGHHGPTWQAVSVNYTGQGQIQFMVVGVFGEKPEPAIAVDSISIAPCGENFPQCNFEDRVHPFCDWSNVLGDSGHWSWGSKSVPTPISGPPREFPYGGEHYIYFDSIKLLQAGQSAKLASPPFCAPGDICVKFAYHMYGLGEGTTLKLLLGSPAGSAPISLWSRVGSQSTGWINSSVTIPKGHQQPMQLYFEATRGTSTAFVVAVNFVLITHGPCREATIVPLVLPSIPTEESTILFEETIPSTEMTTATTEETTESTEETTLPTEVTIVHTEVVNVTTEVTTVSFETSVSSEETTPTEVTTVYPEETTVPTGVTIVSPEETTVPPEETTIIPTGVTTVSSEETTVPPEETTIPTEVTTVPSEETSIPTEVTTVHPEETSIPTEVTTVHPETTIPIEVTTVHPETSIPIGVTTVHPEETTIPTEVATVHPEETTIPIGVTTVHPETTIPIEVTTVHPEETSIPTEVTSAPPEETSIPTEVTSVPPEETSIPTEVTSVHPEETSIPTEVTSVPPEETSIPTEVATVHPEETSIPTEVATVHPEETSIPTEVATVPPEETSIPIEVTTVPPEETSIPIEVTTVPPEETSIPTEETTTLSEGTIISSEETTVSTEESTVVMQTSTTCIPPCPSPSQVPGISMISMAPATGVSESCPPNAHFEPCACPASCESPKPNCQSLCSPGCVCNPGFLFSDNLCINASFCNCFYSNKYYKPGEEWFSPNCTERCHCLLGSRLECQISQCGTHTVCQLKNDQYECQPYGSATCLVYGDLHFVTFDERRISLTGSCTYMLTQTCDNSTDTFFRITARAQERGVEGVSSLDKVLITLSETTITLLRGRHTLIGEQRVTLPAIPSNDIFVGLSGRFVELRTTFGLRVRWDGDQQLFVTVSSTYSKRLCGFCGNYDGDGSNDNRKPDGTMTLDEDELGDSWLMEEEDDKECQHKKNPPTCDSALGRTMSEPNLCGQLVDPSGPFEACLFYLKASSLLDNCVADMCSFQGLQQILCVHMSAMTATCQDAGYPVRPWRGPQFCPLVCPQNSRYSLCAKPCPDTCHPGSALQPCPEHCVEACECDPGFILSGFECVPQSKCGCTNIDGRYFKVQEQWFSPDCKEVCTCEGNNNIHCRPWQCKAQEVCSHKNGILGCHAQGAATCVASGDPHYLTFDGALHHFMGTCTYVLTRPCWSNIQENNFVVSVTNEIRDGNLEVSNVKAVHVQVFDLKISLFKGRRVVLNNQRVALPVWPLKGLVTIRLSGIFVLLYTNFGLQVRYDGNHLVEVTVPSSYTGTLCGLCGNYNNNSLDDNLRPDRKPAGNSLLLGASWKILEASEPGCFVVGGKSSSCEENNMDDTWTKKCAILMNPVGPFSNCHEAVPPQASFSSCVHGQCGTRGDTLALCRSLQAYASLCAQAGQVTTWRNSTFCPLRCPPGSSYNPCANPCPATCLTLSTPRDCPALPCVEGCECEKGHILSGTTCVPLRQCGCSDQGGSYHLLGESWYTEKTCTTLCTCSSHSNVTCNPSACETNHVCLRQEGLLRCAAEMGECHISEDSQIVSFDGHSHPIQDTCTYILVKVCHPNMNLPFFTVSAKADRDTHGTLQIFSIYKIYIDIFSFRVTLQKDRSVLINDTQVTLPAMTQIPGVNITTEDVYTIVTIKDEVQVKFESNSFLDIKISASSQGKVCGVCGNFNGEEEDELMTPSDELAQDEQEFMDSWKDKNTDPSCLKIGEQSIHVEQQEIMNGKCRPEDFEKAQANCQAALQGPAWAQCASRVPLKPFLLGCMNNFCEFRELFRALCEALQSFEDACQNQGLKPPIWRNSSFCPLECPAHSHYTNCLPSCPPSCLDPDSRCEGSGHKVPATCKEGCICHPGYVLNNDKCVLRTHCGCKDAQGVFVPEGKNWISSSCTQNCVCIGGIIECQNFQCPSGALCQDNEDGSSNCVKITLQCPVHTLYTDCLPPCLPSCSNLDGHCKGTSPKVPCKEGCICHPGFVLNKDKCVPRTHCGCKDTQGAFIPAGKTWTSRGCTQTCACTRGTIRCRNFQCPSGTHCKDNNDGTSNCVKITFLCPAHSQYTDCLPSCHPSCSDPDGRCEGASTKAPSACKEGCVCQPGYVLDKEKCVPRIECDCQDTQGGFIPAGKTWTSRGCTQSCACTGGAIQCRNFQCSPGTYCKDSDDGNSNCVKITLQCPAHSQFTNCLPACPPSCLDPEGHCEGASTKAPSTCREGCVCQPGYVLDNDKCVLRIECGCQDTQGAFIPAGKTWISRGCSRNCNCMGGVIRCQKFQCPSGTYCQDREGDTSNCTKISELCPAHSRYTNCLPPCLATCVDPEGHCGGASTKAPSTCREGCVCRHGFVLHNNKCMLRILCGCQDAQGTLIPADKTWINRGCTHSCTCVAGIIYCRDFQCPAGTYCKDIKDGNSNCTKITLQCPDHSLFTDCLPSCQPSCSNLDGHCEGVSTKVPSTCKEGCVCRPGFVFNENKCIPRIQCGCKDTQGTFIPAGKTWTSRGCTQSCTCVGGAIQCQNFQCPQGTYCKDTNDGNSNCTKITLQCPAHSQYTNCLPSCLPSCSDPDGLCRGASPKALSTCKEGCVCLSGYVLDNDKCVLRIRCGCKDAQGVLIPADKTWINRGCTQSCTCVGGAILCRKFQCPSETYCKDIEDGNSNCTRITLQCPAHSQYTNCLPSCLPSCSDPDGRCIGASTKAPSTCREGCVCQPGYILDNDKCVLRIECGCKDAQGALIPADKTWINRGCTQSCICMGGVIQCQNFHCPSGTYCMDTEDGNSNCAKITLQCPAHSQYTNCLPSCLPSCSDPDGHCIGASTKAPSTCREGCVCQPDYVLNNDKCVLRIECGCKDAQGVLIPADKTWINRGCTQSCTCVGGAILCRKFQCPSETYCKDIEDGNSNCTRITLQCPANSHFTDCLPSCQPSCSDMEGHCEGASTKAPSTCKEGCVCQPGYVFHNDKCVLRNQCGCKDAQGALIPESKTWITRGCTQSCTCMGGVIQCRAIQCPEGTYCKDTEDGNSNCTKITLQCPVHSRYTNCLPSCLPSCSDPEGLCGGTSPKVPSTCKEGCVCRHGFVLHDDKCMLRILCSCKDAQGVLIPADKTWITRGCAQSCTCVGGIIHCRNIQCPPGTYCKDRNDGSINCTKITLQCPAHSQFTDCLPSCLPSCSNHCETTSPKGPSSCKEGCLCNPGFVLNENKCVPRTQCGCKDAQGAFIPAGKTWTSRGCTQTCACTEGTVQCQNFQCPSGTYCKDNSDNSSTCTKITLQCPAHSHYTGCLPSCLPSCSDPEGLCKGTSSKVPSTCKEGCVCQPGYVLFNDKCILRVQCGCKDAQGALIPAGKTWTSKDCTQSCACTEGTVQCRSFQCPSGTYCKESNDGSSNCAKIPLQCPAHSLFTSCLPSCSPSCLDPEGLCKATSPKAPTTCKEGCVCQPGYVFHNDKCVLRSQCGCKDAHGALIPADKTWIPKGCTQSCTCTDGTVQCRSFQCPSGTYCKGSNDDSSNCAKIPLQCPANSQFTDCLPSCPPSCLDPEGHCEGTGPKGPSACKEGCLCHPGYVLDKDKCLPRIQCGCKDAQGALIPAGKTWTLRGCTQSCACMGGAVQCRSFQCPSGTYCKDNKDGSSNCAKIPLQCPAHSHFTDCLPSCLPSCLDPEGHCEGASTKAPSACKEGCVCQPGYVLFNGKCVLRIECGCKDNQGAFIPAGKTWIATGCTQSCACAGGTIQCQSFQCPAGTYCKGSNDGSSNCAEIPLQCPDHSLFTGCLPSCPPSCLNLDGRCEGTSPKVPSTCKEGCLCQPGYFLNNGKCVLRIQCDCKDTRAVLIPAGKTWTTRGCTQSCTCTGGVIQCQNFQCPSGTYCKDSSDGNSNCAKITLQCPAHSQFTSCLPSCPPSCSFLDGHCEESRPKVPTACKEGCVCQPGYLLNNDKCVLRIQCDCKDAQGGLIPAGKSWINGDCTQNCNCIGGTVQCRSFQCPPGTYCKDSNDGGRNCVKITLQCPAHSRYTDCLPPCPPSCTDLDGRCEGTSPKAPSTCSEGCLCQPGYVLNNGKCILQVHCGCTDAQGGLIPAGKTWTSKDCTRSCTCMGGAVQCHSFNCPQGTQCQEGQDGNSNCAKIMSSGQCPAHSRYTNCLPPCLPSCVDPEGLCGGTSPKPPTTCREGCVCRSGFVLHNNKCVLRILCGCKDAQGTLIPADKTWITRGCTQNCTCVAGIIRCRSFQCPPETYCKDNEDDSSSCVKVALQCPENSHHTSCLPACIPSCTNLNGHCEVAGVRGPSTCKQGCLCQPGFVLNKDKCVPRVQCGCKDSQGALIPAGKTWISTGCSQKCSCMGGLVQCRVFKCPTGTQCQDIEDGISNCVENTIQCPAHSRYTSCLPSCLPSCVDPHGLCKGTSPKASTCKEGCVCQSDYVLFNDKCVPKVQCGCKVAEGDLIPAGKTWISSGCTQSCTCVGGEIECRSFNCPTGTHCQHSEDGSSNCASNTLQCPAHSRFTNCLPACPPSCADPDGHCESTSTKDPAICKPGCLCLSGYVLNKDKCVLRVQCGCKDAQGAVIPEGRMWISSGCAQSCICTGGTVQCQDFKCPTGSRCQLSEDGSSDCVTSALKCPAHSFYTNCLPSCLPSCSDPEGLCGGTSPKVPSTCKEGCLCRSGFVLHNNKCVLRIHCACKLSQGNLIQTGQTWISSDCTQICSCKGGIFQCQSFQCPSGTHCEVYEDGSSNCVSKKLQCPAHSLYTDCLPSCLPSCSNPNVFCEGTSTKAPSTCKEGCVCRPGFLVNKDKCVRKDQCDCTDAKGDSIPAGKTWISSGCTQSCACEDGAVRCRNFICPTGSHCQHSDDGSSNCAANKLEKCSIFGDPYYHTFDGFTYRFPGRMNYYLIKTVDELPEGVQQLVAEGRNKISSKGSPALHEMTIFVYGYKIQLKEELVVLVNDQKVAVPYSPNDHLRVILRAQRLLLVTDFEMVVDFDGKHSTVISLPTMYRGLIRGLCGNYDKDQANDFMLPNGMLTSNLNAFGNSWEVKMVDALFRSPRALPEEDGGEEEPELPPSECSPEQTALLSSTQACRVLMDPQGPFAACHQIVAPQPFEQHCMSDMCSAWKTKEKEELRCRVLSGYAVLCQEAGANMTGWRDQTRCAMTCPANTVYQSCMTPCPASCAKFVTPKVCDGPCVEGCASIPGYIYSDTQSLPVTRCGCTTNGIYYKLDDSFVTDDCSQRCTCASQGVLLCEPYGCRAGESCTVANFTRGCFRDSPCLHNPCHNDGRCQEQGATFICHCDLGYGGEFCTEPRDIPSRKKLESPSLMAILPGVLVMVLVPVLLPRVYVYMTTRTALARRRRGEKLLGQNRHSLEETDAPEPSFKAAEF